MTAPAIQKSPGLTFCIPNWNHRRFLPRSVRSALRAMRTLRAEGVETELVVVDDASRDGSLKYIGSLRNFYPDLAVRAVFLPRNQGLAAARNYGLIHAEFRHLCLLDADNEVIPENIPVFYRTMLETGAALVYGNLIVKENDQAIRFLSNETLHTRIYRKNYIDNFALLDGRQALEVGGYETGLRFVEDWELMLRFLAERRPIVFVPVTLGYYHQVPGSLVTTVAEVVDESIRRVYDQNRHRSENEAVLGRMYHPAIGWII
jgi:glycosyltransferase involved in cell wall biosynthesis